jgi:murein L,D-transpeptidase YcbB/YkuD
MGLIMTARIRRLGVGCALGLVLLAAGGCRKARKTKSVPNSTHYAGNLQALVATKQLPSLHWPDFSDYQKDVATFYEDRNYELAWTRDGRPTAAARGFIEVFKEASPKGLIPEDYDASMWDKRVADLRGKNRDAIAKFDVAMTVNVMRFISDLRIGRVNPQHFNFDINTQQKKYNLPEFVSDEAVDAEDVAKLVSEAEPESEEYRRTEEALEHYLELAKEQEAAHAEPLPMVTTAVSAGGSYPAVAALWERLQTEGDAEAENAAPARYDRNVAEAVKVYQHRHGLPEDGKLSAATVASMNVPMSARVQQLNDSLERWRWLPDPYLNARLIVNLPEFVLRGFDDQHKEQFKMNVVVGKVVGEHQTPVFTHMMKYLIFRPFWNVPVDIAKKELVPHMRGNAGYLATRNYEVVNAKGEVQKIDLAERVEHGGLMVREKPGPKNSLGLVKFMFPNQYDIYLHSTPSPGLFARSRRDFSHGCVRVQKPEELAVWVLQGQKDKDGGDWDLEKVQEAMNSGEDNHQVNLKTQLPIVIFYLTAHVDEDGAADFFNDIYGYDSDMEKVLAKGPPYPVKPEPPAKVAKPGDTA